MPCDWAYCLHLLFTVGFLGLGLFWLLCCLGIWLFYGAIPDCLAACLWVCFYFGGGLCLCGVGCFGLDCLVLINFVRCVGWKCVLCDIFGCCLLLLLVMFCVYFPFDGFCGLCCCFGILFCFWCWLLWCWGLFCVLWGLLWVIICLFGCLLGGFVVLVFMISLCFDWLCLLVCWLLRLNLFMMSLFVR